MFYCGVLGLCFSVRLGSSSSLLDSQLQHVTSPWNSSIGAAGSLGAAIILLKMAPMSLCFVFFIERDPLFEAVHEYFVSVHLVRKDR